MSFLVTCDNCGYLKEVKTSADILQLKNTAWLCPRCGTKTTKEVRKTEATYQQKVSRVQEKGAEKRYGARRQAASGALGGVKGDLRIPGKLRVECKTTEAKSFSLKLSELEKIEREASFGELPVFEVEFRTAQPAKRYVVLPYWVYDTLMEKSNGSELNNDSRRP
jgi:hypothetical protein